MRRCTQARPRQKEEIRIARPLDSDVADLLEEAIRERVGRASLVLLKASD
jgi:hypothetical protein